MRECGDEGGGEGANGGKAGLFGGRRGNVLDEGFWYRPKIYGEKTIG